MVLCWWEEIEKPLAGNGVSVCVMGEEMYEGVIARRLVVDNKTHPSFFSNSYHDRRCSSSTTAVMVFRRRVCLCILSSTTTTEK